MKVNLKKVGIEAEADVEKLIEKGMDNWEKDWQEKHNAKKEILELKHKLRNAKANMEIVKNSSREVTNVDLLRRVSQLEKIIYGKDGIDE